MAPQAGFKNCIYRYEVRFLGRRSAIRKAPTHTEQHMQLKDTAVHVRPEEIQKYGHSGTRKEFCTCLRPEATMSGV